MITCSNCGAIKRDVNHWFLAWLEREDMRFCVVPWDTDPALQFEAGVFKLCGHNCVTKTLSEWMFKCQMQHKL